MTRKLIVSTLLIVVVMIVTSFMSVQQTSVTAQSPSSPVTLPPQVEENLTVFVSLENHETGEVRHLNPQLSSVAETQHLNGLSSLTLTYEVGISSQDLNINTENALGLSLLPSIVHATTKTVDECDSTFSVCATLAFEFANFGDHMYAQNYKNKWVKYDPAVSWSSAELGGWCNAEWHGTSPDGTIRCFKNAVGIINNPVSGTNYMVVPPFSGPDYKTLVNNLNYQTAYQKINLHRGGANWTFHFCVTHGGGTMNTGCF